MDIYKHTRRADLDAYIKQFLVKANDIYKGNYLYDFSYYRGANKTNSYLRVYCKKHNRYFKTTPTRHLYNSGCADCFREKQAAGLNAFITKAKAIHGDTYIYDKVIYAAHNKYVDIVCKKHGVFKQKPSHHVKGQGCRKCHIESRMKSTVELSGRVSDEIIARNIKRLEEKFPGYKFEDYQHYDKPCKVTCPKHGVSYRTPHTMLRDGAPACRRCAYNSDKARKIFFDKARAKHGDKFDYSKTDVSEDPALFICRKHGEFRQWKRSHLIYDICCPKCLIENSSMSLESFLKKANEKFGDYYDYSKVKLKNTKDKVTIICPIHGEFLKNPSDHVRKRKGGGCSLCSSVSTFEKITASVLKAHNINFVYQYTLPDYKLRWDFYIPDIKLVIEIDDRSHFGKDNTNDKIKDFIINALGGKTARIRVVTSEEKQNLVNNIKRVLRHNISYQKDDKVFKSFLDFGLFCNLPPDSLAKDYQEYKFRTTQHIE